MTRMSGRACLAVAAIALASCDSPRTLLGADDLDRAARDTASLAQEAGLLVAQIRHGHVDANYVWVHQQALQEDTRKAADALHKPAPAALRARQRQVAAVNASLSAALDESPLAAADRGELARLAQVFDQAGGQAKALKGDK
jgi:hypothetical protein